MINFSNEIALNLSASTIIGEEISVRDLLLNLCSQIDGKIVLCIVLAYISYYLRDYIPMLKDIKPEYNAFIDRVAGWFDGLIFLSISFIIAILWYGDKLLFKYKVIILSATIIGIILSIYGAVLKNGYFRRSR